jgi:hypothetical protein
MQLKIPLILLTVVTCGSCRKTPDVIDTVAPVLSSARLYYDDSPAFLDSARQVVRDLTAWRDVWNQATSDQPSPPPRPVVDFSREMILVVSAGKMSPGDWIRVDSAGVRSDHFKVFVRTVLECQRFQADAYPFEIVRVAHAGEAVDWVEDREEADNCRNEE